MDKKREKQKHLGRGLESLLGPITFTQIDTRQLLPEVAGESNLLKDKVLGEVLREISIDSVSVNPYQPRKGCDQQELADLAESIKSCGIIQPVIVRPAEKGFQLIAGERRFRAAQMTGLKTIPALVRQAADEQMLELALVENIHRTNLNPVERARAYQNYIRSFSLTQEQAAERLGQDRSVIANYIRLLELPDEIQQMLIDGRLTMGHARAILALPGEQLQRRLANRALAGRLSVREVERLVKSYLTPSSESKKPAKIKPAHILDLESRLTSQLGTKVCIETVRKGHRGRIIIEFYSLDDFDRITENIGLASVGQV